MAMVPGEDSESDEEINTEHLQSLVLTPDGSLRGPGYRGLVKAKTAGIVMGEESETDEEDDASLDQTDGAEEQKDPEESSVTAASAAQDTAKEEPQEIVAPEPPSLLHKKLRERNQSLRYHIVDRIVKLYRITCRNLTLVNNNLSKAQGTIETVNSNLKRTEHDLSELNSIISDINTDARVTAPNLTIMVAGHSARKSPSPIRQRLFKNVPKVYNILGAGSTKPAPSTPPLVEEEEEEQQHQEQEDQPQQPGGSDPPPSDGPSIPEAQPAPGPI